MKYDYYGQVIFCSILAIVSLLSIFFGAVGYSLVALFGLIPLGIWQLISAGVNTHRIKTKHQKFKPLKMYWILSVICLILFFLACLLNMYLDFRSISVPLFIISLSGSVVVALYYLYILKKLLSHEQQEDSGFGGIH